MNDLVDNRIFPLHGVNNSCLLLQDECARHHDHKCRCDRGVRFIREYREGFCRDPEGFLSRFPDQAVTGNKDSGHDRQHAKHAEEYAFRQDNPQIHSYFEAHEHEHQKSGNRRHAAGNNR